MPRTGGGRPKNPPKKTTTLLVPEVVDLVHDGVGIMEACGKVVEGTDHSAAALVKAYERHKADESFKLHGNCNLTVEEELALACTIIAFDLVGVALPQDFISEMAKAVFMKNLDAAWFPRFYSRHEDILAGRRKRGSSSIRAPEAYRKEGARWVEKIGAFLVEHSPPPHAQFNPDETRLYAKDGALYLTRIGARGRNESTIDKDGERMLGTYIPFPERNDVYVRLRIEGGFQRRSGGRGLLLPTVLRTTCYSQRIYVADLFHIHPEELRYEEDVEKNS